MGQLLDSIDTSELIGLRDRALLGLMGYTFARVSAVVTLRVEDYFQRAGVLGSDSMRKAANGSMRCPAIAVSTNIWTLGSRQQPSAAKERATISELQKGR